MTPYNHNSGCSRFSYCSREAAATTCLAIIFERITSGIPWFFRSTAVPLQLPHQCWYCQCNVTISAGTDVGHNSLKQPAIECLTLLGLSRGMNGVYTIPQLLLLWVIIRPENIEPCFEQKKERETLSTTHNAKSPHPHVIICTSFISSDCFYRIAMFLLIHLIES